MKVISRNYTITCSVSLVFMMLSSHANAVCSRDDVEYYLGKGFSNDQITTLCSESSVPAGETPKSEQQSSEQQPDSAVADDNVLFLKRAIEAKKIDLSSSSLIYTQNICIEYGEEDLFGFTPKVCPDVTYVISLKGLEVLDTGKKYGFYGTKEVRVKSSVVEREIISELKDKKPAERELILEKFEKLDKGEGTAIPVRDDFSLDKVKQILQELSN